MKESLVHMLHRLDARRRRGSAASGQSLVEIAITLPFLLILFLGMVEFGFMLNHYVALTDATRETARFFSNADPFNPDGTINYDFYSFAIGTVKGKLEPDLTLEADPTGAQSSRRILLNIATDDVIVTVYSVCNGEVTAVYPTADGYHLSGVHTSRFTDHAEAGKINIEDRLVDEAPATGLLLVEVFYEYQMVLGRPYIAQVLPDDLTLHSYTIMPLSAAEPASCP